MTILPSLGEYSSQPGRFQYASLCWRALNELLHRHQSGDWLEEGKAAQPQNKFAVECDEKGFCLLYGRSELWEWISKALSRVSDLRVDQRLGGACQMGCGVLRPEHTRSHVCAIHQQE